MNRVIKFCGKREDDGEWVYGDLYQPNTNKPLFQYYGLIFIHSHSDSSMLQVIPETVGQFTGLPSQDKEDIYEGDRLFDYDDDYYVVEFSEGRFVAVGDGFEVDLFEIADRCSIIGNIHDNPELLK